MDIYEYAESINYGADYYDFHSGLIFKIQEYGENLKKGIETKMRAYDPLTHESFEVKHNLFDSNE
jgi:hypothetical protein